MLLLLLLAMSSSSGMTLDQAKQQAFNIWGASGFARIAGKNYQVGCVVNSQTIVVSQTKDSFDASFAAVDMRKNGHHILTAVARDTMNNTAVSAPVDVIVCNP